MIQAMIDFIAPLTVGQTAAVALGAVAVLLILPPLICGAIRGARDYAAAATDREKFDPTWMDADAWAENPPEAPRARHTAHSAGRRKRVG